jgi:hypothetical protein
MSKNNKKSKQQITNPLYKMGFAKICKVVMTTPKPKKNTGKGL